MSGGWGDAGVSYRPIPSEPDYWAGDDGSVWSFRYHSGRKRAAPIRRKPGRVGKKRNRLTVGFCRPNFKLKTRPLPHLILEAFVGPRPPGLEACHNDGNPLNNRLGNLRWDTHESNMEDLRRHNRERREAAEAE